MEKAEILFQHYETTVEEMLQCYSSLIIQWTTTDKSSIHLPALKEDCYLKHHH
jgi:hypothetical protein